MHTRRNWDKAFSSSTSDRVLNSVGSNGSELESLIYEGNDEYYNGKKIMDAIALNNAELRLYGCNFLYVLNVKIFFFDKN